MYIYIGLWYNSCIKNIMGENNMKRKLTLFVCLLMLAAQLASCSSDDAASDGETTGGEAATTEEVTEAVTTELTSQVEAVDFEGREVKFLTFFDKEMRATKIDVAADVQDGEVLNDAVFDRNAAVEEKFNIDVTWFGEDGHMQMQDAVKTAALAGDKICDIVLLNTNSTMVLGLDGLMLNMNDVPYINLEMPWWNKEVSDKTSILGVNYFYMGDLNLNAWLENYVLFFNKQLAEDYSAGDIYSTVTNGEWTLDELDRITRTVYSDLNGNGEYDENDLYGFAACSVCIDCFWAASGVEFVEQKNDGTLSLKIDDSFYSTYDKIVNLLQAPEMLYTDRPQYKANRAVFDRGAFKDDRALFFMEGMYVASTILRDMETDFGILPLPKYSEIQDNYITFSHYDHNSSVSLPITSYNDCEMLGMIIEDMAYFSMDTVRPAYYDKVLSGKIARDEGSVAMLDIITDNISYDLAFLLLTSDGNVLNIGGLRAAITDASPAASYIASKEDVSIARLDEAMNKIRENIENASK